MSADPSPSFRTALAGATTQYGESLLALSERGPTLVVFLRHFG